MLGISVHVLARYEDGQERAPAAVLLELTRHLGCQLTDLFAGMPSMGAEDDPALPVSPPLMPTDEVQTAPSTRSNPDDATVAADIIKAFADLKNPVLRARLIGVLQVLD